MNKIVLTNHESDPQTLQPFTINELNWLQTNVADITGSLTLGLVGTNEIFTPMVVSGEPLSGTNGIKTHISGTTYAYAPCWIYEPLLGQAFYFSGVSALDASLGEYFTSSTTFPDPSDPLTFSDGSLSNVLEYNSFVLSNNGGGSLFTFSQLTSLRGDYISVGNPGAPAYQNGWTTYSGIPNPPKFKFNNMSQRVELGGYAYNPSTAATNTTIFTLPSGYIPAHVKTLSAISYDGNGFTIGIIQIDTSGHVQFVNPNLYEPYSVNLFIYLDSLSFDLS
jgi:hypothetical protein